MKVSMQKARPNLSITPPHPCICLWSWARLPCHGHARPQETVDGPDISPSTPGGKGTSARGCCGPVGESGGCCLPCSRPSPCPGAEAGFCSGSLQRSFLLALSLLENWKTTRELAQSTLRYIILPGLVWVLAEGNGVSLSASFMCWDSAAELTPVQLWCPLRCPHLG